MTKTVIEHDFGGYATKVGLKCSDGRTITSDAFKHMDGQEVPLVWQHVHDNPDNVLGRTKSGTLRLYDEERGLRFELDVPGGK